jgi:hypothetical protein
VTTSTSTSLAQPASVLIPLFNAYSAVSQTVQGTFNGTANSITASYTVVYVSSTTYKVSVAYLTPDKSGTATVWLLKDGTVVALTLAGHNFTGSLAGMYFQEYFVLWETEIGFEQRMVSSTSLSFFHSTGTSTVTVGPSVFTVTNYTANSLPETISECNGQSITLTTGSFSLGTPSGANYPLITYIDVAGSETTVGVSGTSTTTYSFTSQITSVTAA